MALKANEIIIIEKAIRKGTLLRFRYYPNKTIPVTIKDYRYVYPILLFKRIGIYYMYGLYYSGASASKKGIGLRLFFQKNMYEITPVTNSKKIIANFKKISESILFKMILKNEVE